MAYLETRLSFTLLDGADRQMPRRAVAAGLNLASTGTLLALFARAAMMFPLSLGAQVVEAVVSVALAYVWSLAASAVISAMATIAGEGNSMAGAHRTARAAVWLAPAVILAANVSPAAPLAAVLAVIIATRRICEESLDQITGGTARRTPASPDGICGHYEVEPLASAHTLIFPTAAAATAQGAFAAILLQNATGSFILVPLSAAALTCLFVARRRPQTGRATAGSYSTWKGICGVLAATAFTIAGLVAAFGSAAPQMLAGRNSPGLAARLLRTISLEAPSEAASATRGQADRLPVAVGNGDYPGVVLWPEIRPVTLLVAPLPYRPGGWTAGQRTYGIPFGGEYWMYRPPSSRPPSGSYFRRGSPTTQAFHTTDGRPLAMEARQRLEQSLDLRCCSAIEVELSNAEPNAGAISVELMVRDQRRPGAPWGSLGQRDVSSSAGPKGRPVMERITFEVPADPVPCYFDEFRVVFHRRPEMTDKSARIAVERFVLVPRW